MAYTTYGLYAVRAASLGPLELVLVGAMLELSVVLAEVPTGIVADVYGRRLSVLTGLCVIGVGFGLMGSVPTFWGIALGSMLWAVGGTFISGAHQAWLADEVGDLEAAPLYLRGSQFRQLGSLAGIPFGVALAAQHLQLPMLVGAAGFWALALLLALTMSERGYSPAPRVRDHPWQEMLATLRTGIETVRGRPELASLLAAALVFGMSGEAFGRLSPLHILDDIGLPATLAETTWFGILQAGAFLGAAMVTWLASRSKAIHDPRRLVRLLLLLTAVMAAATLTFALASTFWLALIAFWVARWVRIAVEPLMVALMNRGLPSDVRATVLSMLGQAEAFGEVCGGPMLGLVATLRTVRAALVGAAVILLPAFPLFGRAVRASGPRRNARAERI
ncbi:MAG TPA: MFS transporter [Methylomirabilota bacterium]|nr:MFS transporter [Methylomirabilota bacterium]